MRVYPAIDLKGGRVVRLEQGRADAETVYYADPAEPARAWRDAGARWVHVVDLDGAFGGSTQNAEAIAAICETGLSVQVGGGLRSVEAIGAMFERGVARAVVGSRAAVDPEFVAELVEAFGDRVAVGIDAKEGKVAIKGWVETVDLTAVALAQRVSALGVATIIYTDISRDGMLTGPNFEAQQALLELGGFRLIASGGVARGEDIARFREMARQWPHLDGVIVGKALYEKRIALEDLAEPV